MLLKLMLKQKVIFRYGLEYIDVLAGIICQEQDSNCLTQLYVHRSISNL